MVRGGGSGERRRRGLVRGAGGLVRCAPVRTRLGGGTATGEKAREGRGRKGTDTCLMGAAKG